MSDHRCPGRRTTESRGRSGWGFSPSFALGAALLGAFVVGVAPGSAQEDEDRLPKLSPGLPVAFLPVQSVVPAPSGAWPGGAATRREALERFNAEIDFALSESDASEKWRGPGDLIRLAARNPLLDVDPTRLSYRLLLAQEEKPDELHEPLHTQLRSLSAVVNSRLAILPLVLRYEYDDPSPEDGEREEGASSERSGHAVLGLVLVDARASRVIWRGEIRGLTAPVDSGSALATLATAVLRALIVS